MPVKNILMQLPPQEGLPKQKVFRTKFPKASVTKSAATKKMKSWEAKQKAPSIKPTKIAVKPVTLTAPTLKKFAAVRGAPTATAAIDKIYNKNLASFVGTSHSIMTTLAYIRMRDEYKKRRTRAKTAKQKAILNKEWNNIINAAKTMNKAVGGPALTAKKLDQMASTLTKNKKAYAEALNMASTARSEVTKKLTATASINAFIIPQTAYDVAKNFGAIDVLTDICSEPIEGSFTQQYSNSFSLVVRYTYWCPTWTNPFRTCTGSITLAGVSFSMGINVGYRITCCGAAVYGSGYVNACGTIIGITACAGCRATVVGVAGIGRTPLSNGQCQYGLGATANITCSAGGITVFSAGFTFGWTVVGPCPPSPLPC